MGIQAGTVIRALLLAAPGDRALAGSVDSIMAALRREGVVQQLFRTRGLRYTPPEGT